MTGALIVLTLFSLEDSSNTNLGHSKNWTTSSVASQVVYVAISTGQISLPFFIHTSFNSSSLFYNFVVVLNGKRYSLILTFLWYCILRTLDFALSRFSCHNNVLVIFIENRDFECLAERIWVIEETVDHLRTLYFIHYLNTSYLHYLNG